MPLTYTAGQLRFIADESAAAAIADELDPLLTSLDEHLVIAALGGRTSIRWTHQSTLTTAVVVAFEAAVTDPGSGLTISNIGGDTDDGIGRPGGTVEISFAAATPVSVELPDRARVP